MRSKNENRFRWLRTGDEAFAAMLAGVAAARESVRLETYIFQASPIGEQFRDALVAARRRGVTVRVLVDAVGSLELADEFWEPLIQAGGEFHWFNPIELGRVTFRNHRKLLVCDGAAAFIGGFNIAPEYQGDGVTAGWRDLGLRLGGPAAAELAASFDEMFARAEFRHRRLMWLRKTGARKRVRHEEVELLFSGPGRGRNDIKHALKADLNRAREVRIASGYFLPSWTIRRELARVVKRGGRVRLLLAGQSDVPLSQRAGRHLYRGLLRAGAEIYEYEPQILHAKLLVLDDTVYCGSANLDFRSLNINYELVARLEGAPLAAEAREIFDADLARSRKIERATWGSSRSFFEKVKERWAYFLLAHVERWIARRQLKRLR
ncbi:MAG: hypothetical protein HZA89_18440 [Verrucomicrobia bacterium]|nr:hypothetical protein [Verrucomicrobiota bacterium]